MATLWYPNFCSLGGLVFYLNDHQTVFQGPFVQKHTKMKFPKSWVDPFEKIQYGHCLKSIFYILGRLVFLLDNRQTLLQGLFFPKTNEEEICNFWPKSWVDPFKKSSMATMWNPYFYSLGGLVFLTSWSIYLVTCWLHDILIYLLIYYLTGISTYWLNNVVLGLWLEFIF